MGLCYQAGMGSLTPGITVHGELHGFTRHSANFATYVFRKGDSLSGWFNKKVLSEKAVGVNGASPYELLRGLCGVSVVNENVERTSKC